MLVLDTAALPGGSSLNPAERKLVAQAHLSLDSLQIFVANRRFQYRRNDPIFGLREECAPLEPDAKVCGVCEKRLGLKRAHW